MDDNKQSSPIEFSKRGALLGLAAYVIVVLIVAAVFYI